MNIQKSICVFAADSARPLSLLERRFMDTRIERIAAHCRCIVIMTKEELTHLYLIKKMTMQQIADESSCSLTTVYNRLKKHGIDSIKTWNRYPNPSSSQMDLIRGSLLGDANLPRPRFGHLHCTTSVRFVHSEKQKDYLQWKYQNLSSIAASEPKSYTSGHWEFKTIQTPFFLQMRHEIYPKGKKIVTKTFLNALNEKAIAVWYADDGSLRKDGYCVELYTMSFSAEEHHTMIEYFNERWQIQWKMRQKKTRDKIYPMLYMNGSKNIDRFLAMVEPHISPCMRYKTGEKQ